MNFVINTNPFMLIVVLMIVYFFIFKIILQQKAPSIRRNISKVSNSSLDNLKDENIEIQEAEGRATGGLKWKEVLTYLKSVKSISVVIFTSSTMVITQIAATTVDYWLSYWY